jgi:hypothetical protein
VIPGRLVVLLPPHATPETLEVAERLAGELRCTVEPRRGRTVSGVLREGYEGVLAVSPDRVTYHHTPGAEPFFYHPGLAKNRIRSLLRGEPDTLVRAAELKPGMTFLDATLGKATDATVAAHVVGDEGRVDGIEWHPVVAAVVREGLKRTRVEGRALALAMARVHVMTGDHAALLRALPDRSYDVVYFDPFFPEQVAGSCDISALRQVGLREPVAAEAVDQARRIARLRVVHKVRTDRPEPAHLAGWELVRGKRRIGYRVWHV